MTKRKPSPPGLTAWQKAMVGDLRSIAARQFDDLQIIGGLAVADKGSITVRIRINAAPLTHAFGGLPLKETEEFVLTIHPSALVPPTVDVDHVRFVGHAHVLQGQRLCIYLDPSREWDPLGGANAFLDRLWSWLADAASARFNADTALYHAVGGVLHANKANPTIVIRDFAPTAKAHMTYLTARTPRRLDLQRHRTEPTQDPAPVLALRSDLPFGAGTTLRDLVTIMDDPHLDQHLYKAPPAPTQSPAFLTALAAGAARKSHDTPQYFVLTVPHANGGPPHLLAGRVPAAGANSLRKMVRHRTTPLIDIEPNNINPNINLEWCPVSDEREEVTTRRDTGSPVNGFEGKTVHVWGCGGLGSWIAEFVARAGAARIVLCDPGRITGGLLVRQNYLEKDVGDSKAEALARRLKMISDNLEVEAYDATLPDEIDKLGAVDVVIDATVSHAIARSLDGLARQPDRHAVIAQVATDVKSGTLGILTVSAPPSTDGPNAIDQQAGEVVLADGEMEAYHGLWTEPSDGDELIPTRGCSVPTFHGSAADLAAVAATLTTFIGSHLGTIVSGTHLVALPHAAAPGPRHRFYPHPPSD